MLGTIYVGLSGMNAYSKGLDIISNNVANMNTVGYKAAIASFADTVNRNSGGGTLGSGGAPIRGAGVHVNTDQQDFSQGDPRSTGNSLDTSLQGNGFFVLERDGARYYTRAGQFEINKDGILIERTSKAPVMMSREGAPYGSLQIEPFRTFAPRATTEVTLTGTLSRGGTITSYDLPQQLTVNDTSGATHTLRVRFVRNADDALLWTVEVTNETGEEVGRGELRFNEDGTPAESAHSIQVTVTPTLNLPAFTFTINFGAAGGYSGITSVANNVGNNVTMLRQNGLQIGALSTVNFDEHGNLRVNYTNGETTSVARLVLARFDTGADLISLGDGLYVTSSTREPQLSAPLEFGLGRVRGGELELSNVRLTDEFTTLIIVQRGYQASSQMTSVANEMMQQLLAMQDRK
jgi:flagellar hook protein FlgE